MNGRHPHSPVSRQEWGQRSVPAGVRRSPISWGRFVRVLLAAGVLFLFGNCAGRNGPAVGEGLQPAVIRISGSDTMLILTRRWAEEYMKRHPGVSAYVWGGGTARGLEALARGRVDIAAASRPLEPREVQMLADVFKSVGISFAVAKEALSIYVNPRNPIRNLTLDQIRRIFSGEADNWNELGGEDAPIHVLRRPSSSGTYLYLREHVLNGQPYSTAAEVVEDTPGIVRRVEDDPQAIGYGGVAYGPDLHCRVEGVLPSEQAIRDGTYPITRYLFLITTNRPRGEVQRFIDWAQGPAGQAVVREVGFVALW